MPVVCQPRDDDQTQILGVGRKTFERVNLATEFNSLLAAFNPVSFVILADDVQQLLAAKAIEICFVRDE